MLIVNVRAHQPRTTLDCVRVIAALDTVLVSMEIHCLLAFASPHRPEPDFMRRRGAVLQWFAIMLSDRIQSGV